MSSRWKATPQEFEPIPCPYQEPRLAYQEIEPRKVNNLTLIDGKTFLSTTVSGDIVPPGAPDVGFFTDDTRFLSQMELRINGHRSVVLSSHTEQTFASTIELTTGNSSLRDTFDFPENTIHIRREQLLHGEVLFDHIAFENFNLKPVRVRVELIYGADFMDVFQVRGAARGEFGAYHRPVVRPEGIVFHYVGRDEVVRQTRVRMEPAPDSWEGTVARWDLELPPLRRISIEAVITAHVQQPAGAGKKADFAASLAARRSAFDQWREQSTRFESSDDAFDQALMTATADFHALQIPDGDGHIIAAGIPWFATVFGRDSIIAGFQSLALNPQLAKDTLRILARYQGKEHNDWRDEEPGKILHELRTGEMTRAGEMPFSPYYGSVDATPLFLILLSETFYWTADEELAEELKPALYKALDWIDKYGDLDGDGFVEYLRRSERGLANQGWKDSWDANLHTDGAVAPPPIALAEVQGYVYDAKWRMASLLRALGDTATADRLKREAAELSKRFEAAFWMPRRNFYAMALDGQKRQLQAIASNAGHLLFTRCIGTERARQVAERLLADDNFSGWGLRTMSAAEGVFNPMSYHRGSVWPHDNSIAAYGMCLFEFRQHALRVLTGLYQAGLHFRDHRLPELFCGIQRRPHDVPVHYPVSCSPQAWASGAYFLMLVGVLGIRPSAHRRELNIVNPVLPEWLDFLHVRNLRIGRSRVGLDFTRRGPRTFCNVVDVEGEKLSVNVAFRK